MDGDFHNVFRTEGDIQRREAAISDRERLTATLAATLLGQEWMGLPFNSRITDMIERSVDVAEMIINRVQGVPS